MASFFMLLTHIPQFTRKGGGSFSKVAAIFFLKPTAARNDSRSLPSFVTLQVAQHVKFYKRSSREHICAANLMCLFLVNGLRCESFRVIFLRVFCPLLSNTLSIFLYLRYKSFGKLYI